MRTGSLSVGCGLLVLAAVLSGCSDKAADPAATATPAVTADAAPVPAAPLATSASTVIARALAANGRAEAQVVEASRSAGVLTISIRFQRAPSSESARTLFSEYQMKDGIYVVAAAKKYFLLTDTEGKPLALPGVVLNLNQDTPVAGMWYGKFPAPPPEVKQVSLVLPDVGPLDAIPLTDR